MARISYLKDKDFYINFDEACIYHAEQIVAEISSAIQLRLLEYMATNAMQWLSRDMLSSRWPEGVYSESTFYSTISHIRDIHPALSEAIESRKGIG